MATPTSRRHNLEQYKKQAKDLLKAYHSGDPDAVASVQLHLPRLNSETDVQESVSLQEIQHVIARTYQFKDWNWLRAVSCLDMDLFLSFTDREILWVCREMDGRALPHALLGADDAIKMRFWDNVSSRIKQGVEEEISLAEGLSQEEIQLAQEHILMQAALLALQGKINWPTSRENAKQTQQKTHKPVPYTPELIVLAKRPLESLDVDEVALLWEEIANRARSLGVLSLDDLDASPLVREALMLIVDGAETEFVEGVLRTRMDQVLVRQVETRGNMMLEGLVSIQAGDHPTMIRHKLSTFYEAYANPYTSPLRQTEEIQTELKKTLTEQSVLIMPIHQLADILTDMGHLARRLGIIGLEPFVALIDDPILKQGLEQIVDSPSYEALMARLQPLIQETLHASKARYDAVIVGVLGVQKGDNPQFVGEKVRAVFE